MGLVDGRLGTKIVLLVSPPPLKLGTPDQNFMLRVKLLIRVQINRTLGNSHSQVIVKNGVISPLTKIRPPLAALPQNFMFTATERELLRRVQINRTLGNSR